MKIQALGRPKLLVSNFGAGVVILAHVCYGYTMRVIQTLQSPGNEPVEIPLYTGDNAAMAIAAMATGVAERHSMLEPPVRVNVIDIRIEF